MKFKLQKYSKKYNFGGLKRITIRLLHPKAWLKGKPDNLFSLNLCHSSDTCLKLGGIHSKRTSSCHLIKSHLQATYCGRSTVAHEIKHGSVAHLLLVCPQYTVTRKCNTVTTNQVYIILNCIWIFNNKSIVLVILILAIINNNTCNLLSWTNSTTKKKRNVPVCLGFAWFCFLRFLNYSKEDYIFKSVLDHD